MLQDKQQIIEESKDLQKSIVRMLINVMDLRDSESNVLCPEWDDVKDFEQGSREKNIYQINGYLENLVHEFVNLDECLDRIIEDRY
jgi:hypothetical protein